MIKKTIHEIQKTFSTSDSRVVEDFFEPCLKWSVKYDRGVGFFSKEWLAMNSAGMSDFAIRGGHARFLVSPILSAEEVLAFENSQKESERFEIFEKALLESIENLQKEISADAANALAWLVFSGVMEFKFAIPVNALLGGMFHPKFGIFENSEGEKLSFSGSINDSRMGTYNYETLYVFKSWDKGKEYIDADKVRFEKLWNGEDFNVKVYSVSSAIRDRIFKLRNAENPFKKKDGSKWRHQGEAIEIFLQKKHGVLEMATGTGKTRTAMRIMQQLFQENKIKKIVIAMRGDDLLDQWYKELSDNFADLLIRKHYAGTKGMTDFINSNKRNILLVSRNHEYLNQVVAGLIRDNTDAYKNTMFVFDEVHGMGSATLVKNLSGTFSKFTYRLGLSATPEREYDEEGNQFIENEIGKTIFEFTLQDAIKRGVLCEFDYNPISFALSKEDKAAIKRINAKYAVKKNEKEPFNIEDQWRELANVYKLSKQKLPLFKKLLEDNKNKNGNLLENCLIFVETKEYGEQVQNILLDYCQDYHTYFAEDQKEYLQKFAKGKLKCLVSCKKLSEGVDIKTVQNIILFSSDKTKLVTIQRIGRSLRVNPDDPNKKACVIDFVCDESQTDEERSRWLLEVSKTRRVTE